MVNEIQDKKAVIFRIEDEEYAIGISQVERILEYEKITRIPEAPQYLKGVINCLGRIVPVIDLKKRFLLEETKVGEESQIIIAKKDSGDIGIVVDEVLQVLDVDDETLSPPPEIIAGILKEYISSLIKINDRIIIYLNLSRILTFEEREEIDKIL